MTPKNSIDREAFSAKVSPEKVKFESELPCRVLSLDGGGIKGIFTACYLAELERLIDKEPIYKYFHMVAGTSTGGIIALGLAKGLSAQEISHLYKKSGSEVFPNERWESKNTLWLGELVKSHPEGKVKTLLMLAHDTRYSKYSDVPLLQLMESIVGQTTLGQSEVALCIPSVDGNLHQPAIFKTPHHPDFRLDWVKSMLEVGMGTAAAPTYFKPSEDSNYILLDGALIGNNPIMIATVDLLSRMQVSSDKIKALSIGTGAKLSKLTDGQIRGAGLWAWKNAVDHFNYYQSKNALGQTCLMIGPQHVHRVEPMDENKGIGMDDYEQAVSKLPSDAVAQARQDFKILQPVLFSQPVTPLPFFYGPKS